MTNKYKSTSLSFWENIFMNLLALKSLNVKLTSELVFPDLVSRYGVGYLLSIKQAILPSISETTTHITVM